LRGVDSVFLFVDPIRPAVLRLGTRLARAVLSHRGSRRYGRRDREQDRAAE
jgi:hypothetical protein